MYNFRTDLADERKDIYIKNNNLKNIPGIETSEKKFNDSIYINTVKILNDEGAHAINKPIGTYTTIDIKNLKTVSSSDIDNASEILKNELSKLINSHCSSKDEILVVGLGNQFSTPDSLGSKVVSEIEITKHFIKYTPQYVVDGTRSVCAIAPGVLGTTGIETFDIVKGIVDKVKPQMLIVVDSLASKSIERISCTIQISDTGIIPGSGVNNSRQELSETTLGIPVIAIGVPMVVESAVLVNDCLSLFIENLQNQALSNNYLNNLKDQDNYENIKETLNPTGYNMIVTPKEIDDLIEIMKDIISKGINLAV